MEQYARCARTVISLEKVRSSTASATLRPQRAPKSPNAMTTKVRDCSHKHGMNYRSMLGLEPHGIKNLARVMARTRAWEGLDGVTGGVARGDGAVF